MISLDKLQRIWGETVGETDKQYNGQLTEEYQRLMRIRGTAHKENATQTVKDLDGETDFPRLKLQPLELPSDK